MNFETYKISTQITNFNIIFQVAGWGRDERGKHSKQLTESRMPIKSDLECYQKDPSFFGIFLNEGNFCVGYENGIVQCQVHSILQIGILTKYIKLIIFFQVLMFVMAIVEVDYFCRTILLMDNKFGIYEE